MIKRSLFVVLALFATSVETQGHWQSANGPYYSNIQDIAINPQHPDTLFAATSIGKGLYKTENGGETWTEMSNDSNLTRIYALAMDPDDPNILYAGGDCGIDKTTDGGNSWYHLNLDQYIYALAVDPTNSSYIYAGSMGGGVLKSINAGSTWVSMNNGLPTDSISGVYPWVRAIAVNPINPEVIYIGTYLGFSLDGLYKSTNAGSTWAYIGFNNHFFFDIVIDQNNPEVIHVATDEGFYRSLNGGINWAVLFTGDVQSIALDPNNSQIMYCGTRGVGSAIFLSTNGGSDWTDIRHGLSFMTADVRTITINPQNSNVVYVGTRGGLYKAVNESYNWMPINKGLSNGFSFLSVTESDSGAVIYVGDPAIGIYKSVDGAQTWSFTGLLGTTVLAAAPSNPDLVFGAELNMIGGALFRTTDGGINWDYAGLSSPNFIGVVAIDPFNYNLVYVGGFAKSYNGGDDWDIIYEGPNSYVNCISIATQNTQILYAGTLNGIYKSTNEGIDWNLSGMSDKNVLTIALDPIDLNVVFAGVWEEGIFKSTDAGSTWFENNEGLTNLNIRSLIIHPDESNRIYAGTSGGGVFQSLNGGMSWSDINDGLDNLYVGGLSFDPIDPSRIYAATAGGVYIYSETKGIKVNPLDQLPSSFHLFPNYPNPFNAHTKVRFQIPYNSYVILIIYNVLGEEVLTLVKEYLHRGKYTVIWNGKDDFGQLTNSGIYFCQLRAGQLAETSKIILLR